MSIQIITAPSGEEMVVLPRREYDALLARAGDEEAEDRMTLLLAAEARAQEPLPQTVSAAVLNGESLLRAVRRWRGKTQAELASACRMTQGFLSELESGTKSGSAETMERLADALSVPGQWLA